MTNQEVIDIMSLKMSPSRVDSYRQIYIQSTGQPYTKCLCGDGFKQLFNVCKAYSEALIKQQNLNHD